RRMESKQSATQAISPATPQPAPQCCWVCGSQRLSLWKERNAAGQLRPEDFQITDKRYGVTLQLHRCEDCGFIQSTESDVDELVALYEQLEDDSYTETEEARRLQMGWLLQQLQRRYPAARSLLDIGAANGLLVGEAQALGFSAVGVEPSASLASQAQAWGLQVHQGTLESAKLPPGQYDVVSLVDVIEHVKQPVGLLEQAAQRLAPGGVMMVVTPDIASLAAKLLRHRWWHLRIAHVGYFSPSTMEKAASRAGLVVEDRCQAQWIFPIGYLAQRLESYLPMLGPMNRLVAKNPLGRSAFNVQVPLNLFDSFVVFLRRRDEGAQTASRGQ
ncbi:MAG: class I SAM-dependent methyltransferase, partial [Polyangiales bacterium]